VSMYTEGTVTVTHNSQTVVGSSECLWRKYIESGDLFKIVGQSAWYEIASVDSNTQLTLTALYAGETATDQSYVIVRDFTPNYSLPELSKGDLDWTDVYTRMVRTIDSEIRTATTDRDMAGHTISNAYIDGSTISNTYIAGSLIDHGDLQGLDDDDHLQYLNVARHDTPDRHPLSNLDPAVASESEVDDKIATHKSDPDAHHPKLHAPDHGPGGLDALPWGSGGGLDVDMLDGKHANQLPLALSGAKAHLSASQTLAANTWTKINLDVKDWDLNNEFDTTNHRFTVSQAGYYLIVGKIDFYALGTDIRGLINVYKNGSPSNVSLALWAGGNATMSMNCVGIEYLVANDYLELWGAQGSGTDKDVTGAYLWVFRLAL